MTTVRHSIEIRTTAERLWTELTDFSQMHTWFLGVKKVRVLAETPRAGAERILTLVWGASHRERFGHWEPYKSFSIIVTDVPMFVRAWTALIRIENDGDRVTLDWEMCWEPRFGLLGAIFDRLLLRPAIRTALRVSMRRLRRRVEAAPAGASRSC